MKTRWLRHHLKPMDLRLTVRCALEPEICHTDSGEENTDHERKKQSLEKALSGTLSNRFVIITINGYNCNTLSGNLFRSNKMVSCFNTALLKIAT